MTHAIPSEIPEKSLDKFGQMSQPAKNWLTAVLDPFHDYQFDHIAGYPSVGAQPSIVQVIARNYTVSKPAGAAAGSWQCGVFYTGLTGGNTTAGTVRSPTEHQCSYNHTLPTTKPIGPLTIMAEGMAMEMIPDYAVGILQDNPGSTSPYRVIGVGVEVHNTTPPMYRGGACTVAVLPPWAVDGDDVVYRDTSAGPYADRWMRTDMLPGVPVSDTQLRVIPSARTWEASDGVYFVPRMYQSPTVTSYWEDRNSSFEFQSSGDKFYHSMPTPGVPVTTLVNYPTFQGYCVSGFTPMYALFTGLSDQTTLTITFKTIIETFPSPGTVLAPLATPGCPYDAEALRAYSAISAEAPYAVKVKENAAGDFFRSIIQVARAAAPALGLIPHVGGALASAAPGVLDLAQKIADTAFQDASGKLESKVDDKLLQRMRANIGQQVRYKPKLPPRPNGKTNSGGASMAGTPVRTPSSGGRFRRNK